MTQAACDGRYEIVDDIIFSRDGKRTEKVVRAPVSTLTHLMLTPEDVQDLRNVQPFVLTTNEIPAVRHPLSGASRRPMRSPATCSR